MDNGTDIKNWDWEIKNWIDKLRSYPIKLCATADYSESYEMDMIHVFKLENKQYAVIVESGCSCYNSSTDAIIELHPDFKHAIKKFNEWLDQHKQSTWHTSGTSKIYGE